VRGKSRLQLEPELRRRLALTMALDTVTAAAITPGVAEVLVVIEDPADGDALARVPGVRIRMTRAAGLNAAIGDGLGARDGRSGGQIAVLPGDLPSLTAAELSAALAAARPHRLTVVADRQGTGTTLLTASAGAWLRPQYGPDSLRRHVADGALPLELPVDSGLRRDVDQVADLHGVTGPRTLALLAEAGWSPPLCGARPGA